MSRSWAGGSTSRWRKLRAAILAANANENAGRCVLAIAKVCTGTADTVHHVLGKAHGDDARYLIAVCRACNLHVGQPGRGAKPRKVSRW